MESKDFLEWIKKHGLLMTAMDYYPFFEKVLKQNLDIRDERIMIIGDLGNEGSRITALMVACYYLSLKSLGKSVEIVIQQPKLGKDIASDELINRLLDFGERNIIIMCLSGKMGSLKSIGRSFRKYAKLREHKFVSITGLNMIKTEFFPSVVHVLKADPLKMQKKGEKIARILDDADEVIIKTAAGTDLKINKKGMKAIVNAGIFREYGKGGNLPAGEVYFPPKGVTNVHGKVVVDGSIRANEGTYLVRSPVILTIENGSIVNIEGNHEARILKDALDAASKRAKYPENVYKIGEIGIGINPNARILGPAIINEKTLGTAHIANGSNAWFGGEIRSLVHYDHVFRSPEIFVDGKKLII